ncbi:MAG: hypothetical protein H8E40_00790 [Chloroflexi bacterium]|nr:hypothetical protein [Chloroflexota bacterium]
MSQKVNFPVYFERTMLTDAIVQSVDITRYAIKGDHPDKDRIALSTDAGMAFIEQGVTNWTITNQLDTGMTIDTEIPDMITVKATWHTATEALKNNIKVISGSSGNVFGNMGALLVPDNFEIPTVTATKKNVRHYGLELIENGKQLTIRSEQCDIVMMKYDYTSIYKKDFLMQKCGGGGIFVETHEFPHIHIPLSKSCGGYIVIGKQLSETEFNFTAFRIPYGYALYTPSNTIHGDGTLVGEYGLTVADPSMITADTVLVYNENTKEMAHGVVPDWKR